MRLFRNTSVDNAIKMLVQEWDGGDSTDSRAGTAESLISAGAAGQVVYDEILEGFVSDPAIFAAAASGMAGASLPSTSIESLLAIESVDELRELAKDFDPAAIETKNASLGAFIGKEGDLDPVGKIMDNVMNASPDGRAWLMLVAAHLTQLRANQEFRTRIYPFNQH